MTSGSEPPLPALFALREVRVEREGRRILSDLSIDLPRGIVGIVGPSGAGKTSLIRLLNRLDEPSAGQLAFQGSPLDALAVRALRRRIAFVFQSAVMFAGTVADNLRTAASLGDAHASDPAPGIEASLLAVGLDPRQADREACRLSSGEQQRVALARALMTDPEVLLLDEPTSALDPEAARYLLGTVVRLARERGISVLMVTHRLSEARLVTTHTVMLEAGSVVEAGSTQQLFGAARTERARRYLASGE